MYEDDFFVHQGVIIKLYRVMRLEEIGGEICETKIKDDMSYWEARRFKKQLVKLSPRMARELFIEKYYVQGG